MTVFNLRNDCPSTAIRVDRKTPLGNPFKIGHKYGQRENACMLFHRWMHGDAFKAWPEIEPFYPHPGREAQMALLEQGLRMRGSLDLACWCAPERCHAEVIAAALLHKLRDLT